MSAARALRPPPRLHRVPAAPGRRVALWEWPAPEDSPVEVTVVLVHALGFHARCWDAVVRRLPPTFRCLCLDMLGHGLSDSPGPELDWRSNAEALVAALAAVGVRREEVALVVGHSMGGWVSTVASAMGPAPFSALLLVDPVIRQPRDYASQESARFRKIVGPWISKRRDAFESVEGMFERYRVRAPYSTWDPQVLRDYCTYGLGPAPVARGNATLRLLCRPEVEAAGYGAGSVPEADISAELRSLRERGQRVTVLRAPVNPGAMFLSSPTDPGLAKRFGPQAEDILMEDANHFIPMTHPQVVASHILRLVSTTGRSRL